MINKDSLKDEPLGSLVDRAWNCGCGALNSAYNKECGECKSKKLLNYKVNH